MIRLFSIVLAGLLLITACQSGKDAQHLIDQAITAHGGDDWQGKRITFDFRKFHLTLEEQNGKFRYERAQRDSLGAEIRDVLTNDTFVRTVNGQKQPLDSVQVGKYSRSVNAMAYFVLLPFKLRDPAVLADYVGERTVDGQRYDKVRVRFQAEGGGTDHGDTFCYWFNQQTHTMDYLAYSDGGPRFRKAMNPQVVGGIRFQDYINYKGNDTDTTAAIRYDQKYTDNEFTELSRIENKNIRVTLIR